jgi:delta-aminolevulinic acid dehydratase/porphobilinogen synthase
MKMTTTLLGKITLESLYTAQELAEKRQGIRRIMKESEIKIEPSQISQPIDIDVYLEGDQTKDMSNMSDYPYRSLENSIRYIKEVQTFGIKSVVLRLVGKPLEKSYMVYDVLKDHVDAIKTIRKYFPKDVLDITK